MELASIITFSLDEIRRTEIEFRRRISSNEVCCNDKLLKQLIKNNYKYHIPMVYQLNTVNHYLFYNNF